VVSRKVGFKMAGKLKKGLTNYLQFIRKSKPFCFMFINAENKRRETESFELMGD
jgi:hypothetical protein